MAAMFSSSISCNGILRPKSLMGDWRTSIFRELWSRIRNFVIVVFINFRIFSGII